MTPAALNSRSKRTFNFLPLTGISFSRKLEKFSLPTVLPPHPALILLTLPLISLFLKAPSSFNFDNSPLPPYSPPPPRPSYVYAATSKPSLNKQYNNLLPFQPFTSTNRPVYLLELNGRTPLRPPDGCAYLLPPSGPLFPVYSANLPTNNQISVILQFLVQIINMFSSSTSSLLPTGQPCLPSSQTFNYQRHSHPSDFRLFVFSNGTQKITIPKKASSPEFQIDIIAIQETWLNLEFYFSFPDFHILRKNSSRKNSSGLCILIRNNIHFTTISTVQQAFRYHRRQDTYYAGFASCYLLIQKPHFPLTTSIGLSYSFLLKSMTISSS